MIRSFFRTTCLLALAIAAVAGCGTDSGDDTSDATSAGGATSLTHVDGTVQLEGDTLTVTPSSGDDTLVLPLGPEVEAAAVQALAVSQAKTRVFFVDDQDPVAAKVAAAPSAGKGAQTYEGQVVKVSTTSITVDGDDGQRTFTITEADRPAFDTRHLEEHRSEGEAVKIYYRTVDGSEHAVAYEDA